VKDEGEIKRLKRRVPLMLPIRVRCKESLSYEWTEQSRLISVTEFGAGFTLKRPAEPGRLLHLTLPLPRQLRSFDYAELQYCIWSLVRHASATPGLQRHGAALFYTGVAFVGKRPPRSYEQDPTTRYEPLSFDGGQSGMCKLNERPPDRQRRENRLIIPLEVLVEAFDDQGLPSLKEHTVTENISTRGTSVFTSLDVEIGRILRITSPNEGVSVFAAVRGRRLAPDGISRLGLEFINERWPLPGR
jgi:hypothetical protein